MNCQKNDSMTFGDYFAVGRRQKILDSRALRDEHFDFGRDRDGMDLKTSVLGQYRLGWYFFGIESGLFGIFRDYKILFDYAAFIHYESEHLWSLISFLTYKQNCTLSTCGLYSCCSQIGKITKWAPLVSKFTHSTLLFADLVMSACFLKFGTYLHIAVLWSCNVSLLLKFEAYSHIAHFCSLTL
jgi:hypothetical protein